MLRTRYGPPVKKYREYHKHARSACGYSRTGVSTAAAYLSREVASGRASRCGKLLGKARYDQAEALVGAAMRMTNPRNRSVSMMDGPFTTVGTGSGQAVVAPRGAVARRAGGLFPVAC